MKYIQLYERFYNPPSEIKNRLHSIVDELIRKHKGGMML